MSFKPIVYGSSAFLNWLRNCMKFSFWAVFSAGAFGAGFAMKAMEKTAKTNRPANAMKDLIFMIVGFDFEHRCTRHADCISLMHLFLVAIRSAFLYLEPLLRC